MTDRYVQRSAVFGFPDTIVVRFLDQPGGTSTVAIYSRSQLGQRDMGVNKARVERWLAKLRTIVPEYGVSALSWPPEQTSAINDPTLA
jgi:uncharacterized protein (DUF1499 family)